MEKSIGDGVFSVLPRFFSKKPRPQLNFNCPFLISGGIIVRKGAYIYEDFTCRDQCEIYTFEPCRVLSEAYAEKNMPQDVKVQIELAEYTINQNRDEILKDIYEEDRQR